MRAARAHPHLANRLRAIAGQSARVERVLLHGCLSPSSVLFGEEHVAIIGPDHFASGDPALDLAHMMAHLFVASVHQVSSILVTSAGAFHSGYARTIEIPDKLSIMYRAGPLTVAFMLAVLEDEQASSLLTPEDKEVILDFSQWYRHAAIVLQRPCGASSELATAPRGLGIAWLRLGVRSAWVGPAGFFRMSKNTLIQLKSLQNSRVCHVLM